MKHTTNQIRVRTAAQKIMLDCELMGQISDGMWENTHPQDHWQPWTDATVVVDPDHLGRNFWCPKDNYQINSSELLSIVGDRMLSYVQLGGDPSTGHIDLKLANPTYTWERMRKELADLRKIMKTYNAGMPPVPTHTTLDGTIHNGYENECYSCLTAAKKAAEPAPSAPGLTPAEAAIQHAQVTKHVQALYADVEDLGEKASTEPLNPVAEWVQPFKPLTVDLAAHALGDLLNSYNTNELELDSGYADTGNGAAFVVKDRAGQQFMVTVTPMTGP